MYTITIIIFSFICALLLFFRRNINYTVFFLWLPIACVYSWIEFAAMNNLEQLEAWIFSSVHITGIWFIGMAIEDLFFAPIFAILFFYMYRYMDKGINYESPDLSKLITFIIHVFILIFFLNFGGFFGRYQAVRMSIGLICILYTWKSFDVKQFWVVMLSIFVIAGGWDIWANSFSTPQQWFYRDIVTLKFSGVYAKYSWWWFKIGKGWFPLSIFPYYYISGGCFTYGVITALRKFYNDNLI